jgi:hemolysin activation/secretion protein
MRSALLALGVTGSLSLALTTSAAFAFDLPSSADGSRMGTPAPIPLVESEPLPQAETPTKIAETPKAPEGADAIRFTLKRVNILGATGKRLKAVKALIEPYLKQEVTLEFPWEMAEKITQLYHERGYFLTRAYVPAQAIEDGVITLRVAEGFVERVDASPELKALPIVRQWMRNIKAHRPLSVQQLEEAMLELNTLPERKFRAVLNPPDSAVAGEEGATWLTLVDEREKAKYSVRVDNHGSRYLGPYQANFQAEFGSIADHTTSVSGIVAVPTKELGSLAVRHFVPLEPRLSGDVHASYTTAYPGDRLKIQDIESHTYAFGGGITHHWQRQREGQLSSRIGFEWRSTRADILDTPLTRDELRLLRASTTYVGADRYQGLAQLSGTLTQGLPILGASDANAEYLSRGEAKPGFTKLEFSYLRLQRVEDAVQAYLTFEGQFASGPLYSSEEFGYGGANVGRAYDYSEITGDHGLRGGVELRYTGVAPVASVSVTPYTFYDIGKVWNDDRSQPPAASGSSAGVGVRFDAPSGAQANVGVALPLTRQAADPIYGGSGDSPRVLVDVTYTF